MSVQQYLYFYGSRGYNCHDVVNGSFFQIPNGYGFMNDDPQDFPYTFSSDGTLKTFFFALSSISQVANASATIYLLRDGMRIDTGITATITNIVEMDPNIRPHVKLDTDLNIRQGDGIGVYVSIPSWTGNEYPYITLGYVPTA